MKNRKTYNPANVSVSFELQVVDDVADRFYTERDPWYGYLAILDREGLLREQRVHEDDVDFVCAAMNAADRQEKLCKV